MANHINSGQLQSGTSYPVAHFSSYTVYAASTSTITTTAATKTATYTVPAANCLTITDLADSVSVNAAFVVVGLVSVTKD